MTAESTPKMAWMQAVGQAREWWGGWGDAYFIRYQSNGLKRYVKQGAPDEEGRYIVGVSETPGQRMMQYGTSCISFEAAFENAQEFGRGPINKPKLIVSA